LLDRHQPWWCTRSLHRGYGNSLYHKPDHLRHVP
jgi:hypothetical protein